MTRRILLLILLVGGGARIAWVAHAGVTPRFTGDPEAYLLQGETLARGDGYSNPLIEIENAVRARDHRPPVARQPASFYPPGYPAFIAAVVWTVWHTPISDGDLVRAIEYVQAFLGTLSILFVFLLARRAFDARVALLAAAAVAVYPNLITTTATLQLETLFIALSLATVLVLLPAAIDDQPRLARLIAGGALMGLVALVRPTIALLLLAFLAARLSARGRWCDALVAVATVGAVMVAVVLPWTLRNAFALHAFVPVSTGIGPALCMSRNVEATGALDIGVLERQCQPKRGTASAAKYDGEVNKYATNQAIRWIAHHPGSEVRMWFSRTNRAYRHDTSGLDDYRSSMSAGAYRLAADGSDLASYVVLVGAAVGVVTVARRRTRAGVFILGSTLAFATVPLILFGDPRYRVPAEPFFVMLAAAGALAVVDGARAARGTTQRAG